MTATHSQLRAFAAAGLVAAGFIHLLVVPEHLREDWLYGGFFAVSAAAQLAGAALVLGSPSRRVLVAAVVGSVAMLALWAATRTVGIPLGASAGEVEPVGTLDAVCAAFELVTAAAAAVVLAQSRMLSAHGSNSGQAGPIPH